ncbi:protein O-mannosyl-transferase family [Plesiocystis pacifica]|uniref:protein O-mannosyl-transferase family n=1 Tax=Plesiocystis pacifica TaxID=191768 RepID=UPI0002FC50CB|nr:DUF2723 domain-containing protein [Plesiocystis pacifica]
MRHVLAVAWIAFVFLMIGASPAHFWLDSGEIAAAGAELGVMHPTGVPGYIPLLHVATALPVGSLGFRMALCSSLCMAGAIALVLAIFERRGAHWGLVWALGLWMPLGLTLARNARVVEIYAFAALLLAAALWGFDPAVADARRDARRSVGVLAAVVATWGFGDLRLALVPAVVLAWILAWRRGEAWTRWAPLVVALASTVVLTLPFAAARGPAADWGHPVDAASVWAHVQATAIRDSFAVKLAGMGSRAWGLHARQSLLRLTEDLGPVGLLASVGALALGLTRPLSAHARERELAKAESRDARPLREFLDADHGLARWLGWLALVELVYAVAINPMGGRDRQTGLALAVVLTVALGLALHRWLEHGARGPRASEAPGPRKRRLFGLGVLALFLWLPPAYESASDLLVTRSWAPHAWTRAALADAPQDALLLSQSDDLSAGLAAARALEGARPDLVTAPAQHLYREPTPWQLAEPRRASVWMAAEQVESSRWQGQGERGRVLAAFDAWQGYVVLESPTTGALGGVALPALPGDAARLPLAVSLLPPPRDALPATARAPGEDPLAPLRATLARWSGRLDNPVDRQRLADALALAVHGRFARSPDSPVRWLEARDGYGLILDEVDPDHPRSLIGLAAAEDRFGETRRAIELTRRALELDPERSTAAANLALYLSRDEGGLEQARELAELAVELAADKRSNWSRLLQVCQAQGDGECEARAQAKL